MAQWHLASAVHPKIADFSVFRGAVRQPWLDTGFETIYLAMWTDVCAQYYCPPSP